MERESMKSINLMRDLKERLKLRLADRTFEDDTDADGYPILKILGAATPSTVTDNLLLRIRPLKDDQDKKDALGLDQRVFGPHKLDILKQKTASTDTPANKPVDQSGLADADDQAANMAAVLFEASKQAMVIRILDQADNTDAVVAKAHLASAVLVQELRDLWFALNSDV
jgi:hypothetical protein